MKVISDIHFHSRFSRAVSPQMVIPTIAEWANKKGISLAATGDWTHPVWLRELKASLVEAGEGVYKVVGKKETSPYFLLSTEVSSIYAQGGEVRRIHTLIFAPSFGAVEKINQEFAKRGGNLLSDGRPIFGLSAKVVAEIALEADEKCLIIPAHAWTPWFSLYGSKSGFDSIEECFGEMSDYIYAIETGLSSDPAMNWRIEELAGRQIVSFSDAHSPQKLGREATVFEMPKISYENVRRAIVLDNQNTQSTRRIRGPEIQKVRESERSETPTIRKSELSGSQILYTIEFYPEEGKYHYTGHRKCGVVYSPNEARKKGIICPVCGKPLTVGVMSRVESLARKEIEIKMEKDKHGVRWIKDGVGKRPPYVMLVPLIEIITEALKVGQATQQALTVYEQLVNSFGSEFNVLLTTPIEELTKVTGPKVCDGIKKVRAGDIVIEPGYDGVFGKVKIWKEEENLGVEEQPDQATLF